MTQISQAAIEVINTISNLYLVAEQIKVCASNKAAIKELRSAGMIVTGQVIKLTRKGKEFCSAMGNNNHNFYATASGYEYTMIDKYLMANKDGNFYYTDEVTFKREKGCFEEVVTRVNVKIEDAKCGSTDFYWKVKK